MYKSDIADVETLGRYYQLTDFKKWELPTLYPTERSALAVLRRIGAGGRILDFGCSSGRLLERLVADYQCFGYEPNKEAAAIAASKQIRMLAQISDVQAASLDAVVMIDVFEHLSRPTQTLRQLAELIKPGGVLLIVTGNADSAAAREYGANFWYWRTIEHLSMFTRAYGDYLCHQLRAPRIDWDQVSHYDTPLLGKMRQHAQRFAYRAYHASPPPPWRWAVSCIPWLRGRNWSMPPAFTCSRTTWSRRSSCLFKRR